MECLLYGYENRIASITVSEWLRLLPFLGVLALLGYLAVRPFLPKKKQQKDSLINLKIQKENPKVVNEINIEDLCLTKAAYCRCWRSKTFPACDGSHNKHNELTGDNVGPLILKKKEINKKNIARKNYLSFQRDKLFFIEIVV
ncbi:CDGSH iron-sulfur domain-containing protein 2 isoform X3 [Molossus molossus]|uniref:CDGSH iron-sulfur domain-containing protein 2 isoform X3 n=1 Tax=Molossus molossus TaxID=27622 RepID=UPI00174686B8|nr:CDGSH iron-sulfur domain-containing protein 2 isoform X3 [Molossus molossus]